MPVKNYQYGSVYSKIAKPEAFKNYPLSRSSSAQIPTLCVAQNGLNQNGLRRSGLQAPKVSVNRERSPLKVDKESNESKIQYRSLTRSQSMKFNFDNNPVLMSFNSQINLNSQINSNDQTPRNVTKVYAKRKSSEIECEKPNKKVVHDAPKNGKIIPKISLIGKPNGSILRQPRHSILLQTSVKPTQISKPNVSRSLSTNNIKSRLHLPLTKIKPDSNILLESPDSCMSVSPAGSTCSSKISRVSSPSESVSSKISRQSSVSDDWINGENLYLSSLFSDKKVVMKSGQRKLSLVKPSDKNKLSVPSAKNKNAKNQDDVKTSSISRRRGLESPKINSLKNTKTNPRKSPDPVKIVQQRPVQNRTNNNNYNSLSDQLKKKDAELYAKNTQLQRLKSQTDHSVRGVEALTILLHYLTTEYSAFSTPKLKSQIEDLCSQLSRLKVQLDDSTAANQKFQQEALQKEKDFNAEINSLQEQKSQEISFIREQHTTEIANLKNEHERNTVQLLEEESAKRTLLEQRHNEDIKNSADENNKLFESLKAQHKAALDELDESHMKNLKDCESKWALKEHHLLERKEKLEKEKEYLVEKSNKLEQTLLSDNDHRLQAAKGVCTALQKEVESLKSVLDMKNGELHLLREQVADRESMCDTIESLREKIRTHKATIEDLRAQMEKKTVNERQRIYEYRVMSDSLQRESCANQRLVQEKEELLWKLRNRDGNGPNITSTPVADDGMRRMARHDFSIADIPHFSIANRLNNTFPTTNGKRNDILEDSPPGSPCVKEVIEKSNSVSFTLDLSETEMLQRERTRSYSKSPETPRSKKSQNIRKTQLRLDNLAKKDDKNNTDNSGNCSIPRKDSEIEVDRISPTGVSWTVPVGPRHLRNPDVDEFEESDSSLSMMECCDSDVSQCGSNGGVEISDSSECVGVEISDSSEGTEMWVQNPQDGAGEAMIPCDILPKDSEPTPNLQDQESTPDKDQEDPLRPLSSITSILSSDSEDPKISWSDDFDLTSSSEIQDNVS